VSDDEGTANAPGSTDTLPATARADGAGTGTGTGTGAELTYPATDLRGFLSNHFGPSMLWALISIGGSHIVLAPTIGGLYGLFGVWIFLLIYAAKYGGWELGIRYNYGAGENPIAAYDTLPGPKNWALWVTVLVFTVMYTGITASVGVSSAAFLAALVPIDTVTAHVLLVGLAAGFVLLTRYTLLERVLIAFTVATGLLLVVGVLAGPPSPQVIETTALAIPDLSSAAFVGLFAAAAGFAPTGFSTSILIGSWSMAKDQGARELKSRNIDPENEAYHDYVRAWIRTGRRDFNLGYAFSFVLVVAMVVLAANVLYPNPPTDRDLALVIGDILSESFGPWSFYAVIIGAFAALYSTVITLLDGASRATADILPMALDRDDLDSERIRKIVVAGIALGCIVPVVVLGALPVTFVVWIAAILAVTEIFFYPANWYIVENHLPEPFRPSAAWRAYYVLSLALVVVFGGMGAAYQLGLIGG